MKKITVVLAVLILAVMAWAARGGMAYVPILSTSCEACSVGTSVVISAEGLGYHKDYALRMRVPWDVWGGGEAWSEFDCCRIYPSRDGRGQWSFSYSILGDYTATLVEIQGQRKDSLLPVSVSYTVVE